MTAPALDDGRLLVEDTDLCARCDVAIGAHPDRKPASIDSQVDGKTVQLLVGSDHCAWLTYAEVHRLCPIDGRRLDIGCAHTRSLPAQLAATGREIHFGGTS